MNRASWADLGRLDKLSRIDAPAQHLDSRIKAIVVGMFILTTVSFPRHEIVPLLPLFSFPAVLIAAGRLPAWYMFQKVCIASLFALAVGILQPVFERQPAELFGREIALGWLIFGSIMTRSMLVISASLALLACTGVYPLCAGLARLGLPRLFVVLLLMVYRYLFVIVEEGGRMWNGWQSRSFGKGGLPMRLYGEILGSLLLRTLDRAERVHHSMESRGFDGNIRLPAQPALNLRDGAFLVGWAAFFVSVRWGFR